MTFAADALHTTLPRSGTRLATGEPFSILAMGDSVTATGNRAGILARLLARATGNRRITVANRGYTGRSADATARFLPDDLVAAGVRADLGLLMYGLNDQVCFVPFDAFLEHYRLVAERLAAQGGDGIEASARAMWPVYPRGYDQQMTSLIEHAGQGDTIHPNALGHLAIAGTTPVRPLCIAGVSRWEADGVHSALTVSNATLVERTGRIEVHPQLEADLRWAQARRPEDLLRFPADICLAAPVRTARRFALPACS